MMSEDGWEAVASMDASEHAGGGDGGAAASVDVQECKEWRCGQGIQFATKEGTEFLSAALFRFQTTTRSNLEGIERETQSQLSEKSLLRTNIMPERGGHEKS